MKFNLFLVNAFTTKPFRGNPAIVCILNSTPKEKFMEQLAQEFNQPITAFVYQRAENEFDLRWFTPTMEINLCGHGTLASSHVLWEQGYLKHDETIHFNTKAGLIVVRRNMEGIELIFPSDISMPIEAPPELREALKVPISFVEKNRLGYIVELENEEIIPNLEPNFDLLSQIPVTGFMVTSRSSSKEYDFISRYFAPSIGINEDPVTGSAHCGLAPYWSRKLGKDNLTAYQASTRGGIIKIQLVENRVLMTGKALTIFQGKLNDI